MSTSAYQETLRHVQQLSHAEQLELLEALASLVRHGAGRRRPQSILRLQGLGKELWKDVEAQDYVNRERDAWDG